MTLEGKRESGRFRIEGSGRVAASIGPYSSSLIGILDVVVVVPPAVALSLGGFDDMTIMNSRLLRGAMTMMSVRTWCTHSHIRDMLRLLPRPLDLL